jgi:hypothetical protein
VISDEDYRRLAQVADLLLPGDGSAPAAGDLRDLDALLRAAVVAVAHEAVVVEEALAVLPVEPTWESLAQLDRTRPELFEVLAAVTAGAYFMSPLALDAIGYPHGPRHAASPEQVVDELDSGILDPVLARPRTYPGLGDA